MLKQPFLARKGSEMCCVLGYLHTPQVLTISTTHCVVLDVDESPFHNQMEFSRILPSFLEGVEDGLDGMHAFGRMAVLHQTSYYLWSAYKYAMGRI